MYPPSPKYETPLSPNSHQDNDIFPRINYYSSNTASEQDKKLALKDTDEKEACLHLEEPSGNNELMYRCMLPTPAPAITGSGNEKEAVLEDNYMFSQIVAPTMAPYMVYPDERYEPVPISSYMPNVWPYNISQNEGIFQAVEIPKKVGRLSAEERYRKVMLYREKRKRRVFSKRINYQCRKRVADQRIRVQGRFVAKKDAIDLIKQIGHNESELNNEVHQVNRLLNNECIKEMLKTKKNKGNKKAIFKTKHVDHDLQ